jgi:hypothetical protein
MKCKLAIPSSFEWNAVAVTAETLKLDTNVELAVPVTHHVLQKCDLQGRETLVSMF